MKAVINFGHGPMNVGYDPGAIGPTGYQEATQNKEVGELVVTKLQKNGWDVLAIQDGDLWDVTKRANDFQPEYFLSIHANSFVASSAHGIETIALEAGGMGEKIAREILKELVLATGLTDRGVKFNNLHVLRETDCPAALVEIGFISNSDEEALMKQNSFDETVAAAICRGLSRAVGVQYTEVFKAVVPEPEPVLYRVILDNKQVMALSSQDAAVSEVKKAIDAVQALKGVVQRNFDSVNVFEYVKTPIMGKETITIDQCRRFLTKHNPEAPDIIPFYKKHGEALGIRWGYAVAQMIKETNYLKFNGAVKPGQNNFAGIGTVSSETPGATFKNSEEGVIAQLQHLYAYASKGDLGADRQIDPRFNIVQRGSCPNWEDLNGHWAIPGIGYGEDIVRIYGEMFKENGVVSAVPLNRAQLLLQKVMASIGLLKRVRQ